MVSYFDGLLRYFELGGRSSRRQYWLFALFSTIVIAGAVWFDLTTGAINPAERRLGFFSLFALIVHVVPGITVTVRRLHDSGRSGAWYLLNFVPLGSLVVLVFMCLGPTPEADRYGDDPRQGPAAPARRGRSPSRSEQIVAQIEARRQAARFGRASA